MKKLLAISLALVMLVVIFAACGDSTTGGTTTPDTSTTTTDTDTTTPKDETTAATAEEGKVLYHNIGASPRTLDPGLNAAVESSHLINNMYEGLYRDVSGQIVPGMALSHDMSDDGTVYTFHLREDAKWSDGKPVTAGDFEFAWKRVINPALASEYATLLYPIKNAQAITESGADPSTLGVVALDEKTLEVTLEGPTSYFLSLVYFPTLMPVREDAVDDEGSWAFDPSKSVSNGPFTMSDYKIDDEIVLTKNANYWNADNVKIDKIVGKMIVEESTVLTAFRSGDIMIAPDKAPVDELPQLAKSGEVTFTPAYSAYFVIANQTADNEAIRDPNVIKALRLAVDRQHIVSNLTRGGQTPATGIVPFGNLNASGQDFRDYADGLTDSYGMPAGGAADVEAAKKLLADAGYTPENPLKLTYSYNTAERHQIVAEYLQEAWGAIGVEVELKNSEWAVFQDERKALQYTGLARHGWSGDFLDPRSFIDIFMAENPNGATGWTVPAEFNTHLANALSDPENAFEHYAKAEQLVMDQAGVIPLFYDTNYVLVDNNVVTGWEMSVTHKLWLGNADIIG